MITKMKKLTFLVYHKEYEEFLKEIRELGVIHVSEKQQGTIEEPELQDNIKLAGRLTSTLSLFDTINNAAKKKIDADKGGDAAYGLEVLDEVERLKNEKSKLGQQLQTYIKEETGIAPWGNFTQQCIKNLHDAGIDISFYICPENIYNSEWEDLYNAIIINKVSSKVYFVTLTKRGDCVDMDVEQVKLPRYSLTEIRTLIHQTEEAIRANDDKMASLAENATSSVKAAVKQLHNEIEFSKVLLNTEQAVGDKLMILEGWMPETKEKPLIEFLDQKGYFYREEKVELTDDVPILLKNNSFSKLYEPITRMFALPNYSEIDPTPLFAPFFMLFFGLCMGDGGYGLIIFFVCWLLKKKVAESYKGFCTLGELFGIATVIVGILTGSFFGIALDSVEWSWLKGIKEYFITEKNYAHLLGGYSPLMIFAVVIGLIQILFGMCVNAAKITKQFGLKNALSSIAWVVLLITIAIVLGLPALGVALPLLVQYALYGILGICILCVLFYNTPGKNIFANFGSGLWDTYNMATGILGDTLSYIRLFALGLTGGILGGVFNTLAFDLTSTLSPVPRFIAAFLILILGHSINFGLCMISSLVHPMRLTFVEFYKNAGFEGGGKEYKPFKK